MTNPPSCYGCVHLAYRGPIGILPPDETTEDEGRYKCRSFGEDLGSADGIPRPILPTCKENF